MPVPGNPVSSQDLARELLEIVPTIMHDIRFEMRRHRGLDLSVPQFRALAILRRHPGISLAELAEQVGLLPSSASAMVEGLASKALVARTDSAEDRRRIELRLTAAGAEVLAESERCTRASLAERFAALPEADREQVYRALELLRPLYGLERDLEETGLKNH